MQHVSFHVKHVFPIQVLLENHLLEFFHHVPKGSPFTYTVGFTVHSRKHVYVFSMHTAPRLGYAYTTNVILLQKIYLKLQNFN